MGSIMSPVCHSNTCKIQCLRWISCPFRVVNYVANMSLQCVELTEVSAITIVFPFLRDEDGGGHWSMSQLRPSRILNILYCKLQQLWNQVHIRLDIYNMNFNNRVSALLFTCIQHYAESWNLIQCTSIENGGRRPREDITHRNRSNRRNRTGNRSIAKEIAVLMKMRNRCDLVLLSSGYTLGIP